MKMIPKGYLIYKIIWATVFVTIIIALVGLLFPDTHIPFWYNLTWGFLLTLLVISRPEYETESFKVSPDSLVEVERELLDLGYRKTEFSDIKIVFMKRRNWFKWLTTTILTKDGNTIITCPKQYDHKPLKQYSLP